MSHTKNLFVAFGVATSVSRGVITTVSGFSEVGGFNDSKIRTSHQNREQGIVVLESGRDISITLSPEEPFLRDGGEYALLFSNDGKEIKGPFEIVRTSDMTGHFIKGGIEPKGPQEKNITVIVVIAAIFMAIGIITGKFNAPVATTLFFMAASLAVIAMAVIVGDKNKKIRSEYEGRATKRRNFICEEIEKKNLISL